MQEREAAIGGAFEELNAAVKQKQPILEDTLQREVYMCTH